MSMILSWRHEVDAHRMDERDGQLNHEMLATKHFWPWVIILGK